MKKIGIYIIISPKGRVYIGQSIEIIERWERNYKKLNCKGQVKLYNSLKKHGSENHTFEILEECSESDLDDLEAYYKTLFLMSVNWDWKQVLFCKIRDKKGGIYSEEILIKMRIPKSQEFKESQSEKLKKIILQYDKYGYFIREWSSVKEASENLKVSGISRCLKGTSKSVGGYQWRYKTENYPLKIDPIPPTKPKPEWFGEFQSNRLKGRIQSQEEKSKRSKSLRDRYKTTPKAKNKIK